MDQDHRSNRAKSSGPLRIFIGYDPRQPIAYNVLQHSIARHASRPVAITPLILAQLPIKRRGLTDFTYSRFLVPWLCRYRGQALFLDSDMVVTGDIAEVFFNFQADIALMMEQAEFEWASAIVFNCERCTILTPEFIDTRTNILFDMHWTKTIAALPQEWNKCVGYTKPGAAKLYHYTQGIPIWPETRGIEDAPYVAAAKAMLHTVSWSELMGNSVHAQHVKDRLQYQRADIDIVPSGTAAPARNESALRGSVPDLRPGGVEHHQPNGGDASAGLRVRSADEPREKSEG